MDTATSIIRDYAQELFAAHGDRAIVEASEKARRFEKAGDREQAETWRRVAEKLKSMRGPHVS